MPDRYSHGLVQREPESRFTPPAVRVHAARSRHQARHDDDDTHTSAASADAGT